MAETPITLPQLTNDLVISARKTRLCAYAVALEGWRRGLKLKWYTKDSEHFQDMIIFGVNPPGRLYSLRSKERTHYFFRTRGDKVTNAGVEIGSEKDETKVLLESEGVPVPKGRGFGEEGEDEQIITYSRTLGFPLVLKPTDGSLGLGVVTNIRNEEELKQALDYVRRELEYVEVIVEQYVVGKEYRVYVIEDQVIAAYNRIPANITGDGKHTIEELIELKNDKRRKNARLVSCLIEIDTEILDFIQHAGYTLDSILEQGKLLYLREKTNVSIGGDPIDVTDDLSDEVKTIAINALKSVPGLTHGGVDIIVNEGNVSKEAAVVIELNPTAQIGGILYPLEGKARNIPAAIIDYYFPETKGTDTTASKIYFDLDNVLEPLENRSAMEVEVTDAPLGKLHAKKFNVSGTVHRQSYHSWLKIEALDRQLNGHIKTVFYGEIEVVVAGTNLDAINEFGQLISQKPEISKVKRVKEDMWDSPVKVGFEISERYNMSSMRSVETSLKRIERDLRNMGKETYQLQKQNRYVVESNSWKVTLPMRKVGQLLKKIR